MARDDMELNITIETPDGERVLVSVGTDSEAEYVKAEATAQGNRIVGEEIGSLR